MDSPAVREAYLRGARMAMYVFSDSFPEFFEGEAGPYRSAVYDLAVASPRNLERFLGRVGSIKFRKRRKDADGKVVYCEAYFSDEL
jgi:hypothetical protein